MTGRRLCTWMLMLGAMAFPTIGRSMDAPPSCAERKVTRDSVTPVADLWQRVVQLGDSDPMAALDLLCGTLDRINLEEGPRSLMAARWVQAMATPLIAYMNRFDEADMLLQQARPILERNLGPSSAEVAELHVAVAWMSFRRGNLQAAANAWTAALAVRERIPGTKKIELQKVLVGLAQVRLSQRQFAEALLLAERADAILRENGETISEAAAALKNLLANIELGREDFDAARVQAQAQVQIELALRAARGPDQPVTAYALLGQVQQRLNEFDAAESSLREAVRLSRSADGPLQRNALIALVQLSALLNERGAPREASDFARQAIELGERELGAEAPNLVPVLFNLAQAERTLGNLAQSLRLFQRADAIVTARPSQVSPLHAIRLYRGYAELLQEIGDRDEATVQVARAETLSRSDAALSVERAAILLTQAQILEQADPSAARAAGKRAVVLLERGLSPTHPQTLRALNGLCAQEVASTDGSAPNCDEAQRRLAVARYADPLLRQAITQNLAERAGQRADFERMREYALDSLLAAAEVGTPDVQWKANFLMARSLQAQRQRSLAIFFGKLAVDELQQLRRSLHQEDARLDAAYVRDKVDVYRALANWLLDVERIDEALEVLRLMKGEERGEFLRAGAPERPAAGKLSRSLQEQALSESYQAMFEESDRQAGVLDELLQLRMRDRITPAEREKLDGLLAAQQRLEVGRRSRLESFMRGAPQGGGATPGQRALQAMSLDRELRSLGRDAALVIYLMSEDRLRMLIATRLAQVEITVPIDASQLRRDIGFLLDGIASRGDVTTRARELHRLLLRPAAEAANRAGATRLVLWPDGALRYVPFAALMDQDEYVVERFTLQLYSGVASRGPPAVSSGSPRIRGLGVTRALQGFPALPGVGDELCSIVRGPVAGLEGTYAGCQAGRGSGALSGLAWADARFTQQQFEAILGSPRDFGVLHVGTHFSLRPGNAMRSFLLLGSGERITVDRLAEMDFSGLRLLTLSACQTGLGGVRLADGREIEGLSSLMQQRGVERVVASLWPVEDRSTALLMAAFYRGLAAAPAAEAKALRRAQLEVRDQVVAGVRPYRHPYYWAGFTLSSGRP